MQKNSAKQKKSPLVALRFKEVRKNYFHAKMIRLGSRSDHTREDLGEYLGVTSQTISNYENGVTPIPLEHLRKLSQEYNIRLEWLLGEDNFRTLEEKRNAWNKQQFDKHIYVPFQINDKISEILELLGYDEIEDVDVAKHYFTVEMPIPEGYSPDDSIPESALIFTFKKSRKKITPHHRTVIKRRIDNKTIHISDDKIDALFDDIIDFVKYRIDKEFK